MSRVNTAVRLDGNAPENLSTRLFESVQSLAGFFQVALESLGGVSALLAASSVVASLAVSFFSGRIVSESLPARKVSKEARSA